MCPGQVLAMEKVRGSAMKYYISGKVENACDDVVDEDDDGVSDIPFDFGDGGGGGGSDDDGEGGGFGRVKRPPTSDELASVADSTSSWRWSRT